MYCIVWIYVNSKEHHIFYSSRGESKRRVQACSSSVFSNRSRRPAKIQLHWGDENPGCSFMINRHLWGDSGDQGPRCVCRGRMSSLRTSAVHMLQSLRRRRVALHPLEMLYYQDAALNLIQEISERLSCKEATATCLVGDVKCFTAAVPQGPRTWKLLMPGLAIPTGSLCYDLDPRLTWYLPSFEDCGASLALQVDSSEGSSTEGKVGLEGIPRALCPSPPGLALSSGCTETILVKSKR